jgi:signal transduction histidine kinase
MIKKLIIIVLISSSLLAGVSEKDVISIVEKAVAVVNKNCSTGIKAIGKKNGDFHKGSLYVFGYDENVVMVVHPVKPHLIGRSYKGKPDVRGKKFRDEIVSKALSGGGWTTYTYQKPGTKGMHKKKSYSKTAKCGKKTYILAAGMYDK